ncbi:hypothetical protein BFINE_40380 [Bacteroides finegoldii DSM 17565]|nr:hypothetical protein BFINE_40380 [Bacteroides finegoldii DSM 17565]
MADNLKSQLFSGVFYTALAKYSGVVISLVVAGVLARLLSPDDFGIVAIATVIIAFFNLFTDMGVSPAIVQHKTLTREELSDIFSFTVWTGIGISALFFAASWLIAGYYNSDILRTLCQLLSVNLFFASATIVPGLCSTATRSSSSLPCGASSFRFRQGRQPSPQHSAERDCMR